MFVPKAALSGGGGVFRSRPRREKSSWTPWIVIATIGVFVIAMMWALSTKKELLQNIQQQQVMNAGREGGDRIFVSIASYRDPECGKTLHSLFLNADNPLNIDVGVCQQNRHSDKDCIRAYEGLAKAWAPMLYTDQVGVLRVNYNDATGPCWAREQIESKLYQGQRYVLQIDSHMRFAKGWDTFLIRDLESTKDEKAILTGYPPDQELRNNNYTVEYQPSTFLRPRYGQEIDVPVFEGPPIVGISVKPFPTLGWSGCFSFSRGDLIKTVPYLKNVPFLFFGEEFTMSCLYFIFGFNCYAPTKMPCVTTFDREYRPTFWELKKEGRRKLEKQSLNYIYHLLGFQYDNEKQEIKRVSRGIEGTRPLDEWLYTLGVDLEKKTISKHGRLGVTPQPTQDEILTKYGSNTRFLDMKNQ